MLGLQQYNIHMNGRTTVSQQNVAQSITQPTLACLFSIGHPSAISFQGEQHTPSHSHAVKENMIHQTRPPSSIAPWSNFDAHMSILGVFGSRHGSAWAHSPLCSKLWRTICSNTFQLHPVLIASLLWDHTKQSQPLLTYFWVSTVVFSWTTFYRY